MSRKIVWFGTRGKDVEHLQGILTRLGCMTPEPGYEDPPGEFGPQTDAAVLVFQSRNGIQQSPIVDAFMWEVLEGADAANVEGVGTPVT